VTPSRRGVVARRVASGGCADAAGVMMVMSAVKNMGPFPILRLILMLVDSYADLNRCQLTCRTWRAVISDNAMLDRLFDEGKTLEFNDWGAGVRPGQVTAEMVQQSSIFAKAWAKTVNVFVAGEPGAGKTSLANRLCQGVFHGDYDPKIEDVSRKQIHVLGAAVVVNVTDTAGDEEFLPLWRQLAREAEGIVLCVDISHRAKEGLAAAGHLINSPCARSPWSSKPNSECGDALLGRPILLCATKCDLLRQIKGKELKAFVKTYRTGLIVTSSKQNTRVAQAFEECAKYAAAQRLIALPKKPKKGCVLM
jgi:GTPase SAR1 family protein